MIAQGWNPGTGTDAPWAHVSRSWCDLPAAGHRAQHPGTPQDFRISRPLVRLGLVAALMLAGASGLAVAVAPVAPPPDVARFDGSYGGSLVAAFAGRAGCTSRAAPPRLTVAEGRVRMESEDGLRLEGGVDARGLVVLSGFIEGPSQLTGRFVEGRLTGELRGWNCLYEVELTRTR